MNKFNFIVCFYFAYARSFARSIDIEATKISKITHISEVTLWRIFKQIRILITKECENISKMQGEIEIDESYFCFISLATASRRNAKTKWLRLYTNSKELLF